MGNRLKTNGEKVILEWKYDPPDFFEAPFQIENDNYRIEINNGDIKATISPEFYDSETNARLEFHEKVNALFLGVQTLNFKPFNLSEPSMCRLHSDGRRDITIFPDPGVCKATISDLVDLIIEDKDGNKVFIKKDEILAIEQKKK